MIALLWEFRLYQTACSTYRITWQNSQRIALRTTSTLIAAQTDHRYGNQATKALKKTKLKQKI